MASIDKTNDETKEICWARGDSDAKGFTLKDSTGAVIDITGFSFKLTVNAEKDPTDQVQEQFSLTGSLPAPTTGKVSFAPLTTDTDITPGKYFYDIEQTDGGGAVSTIIKGVARIIQDITKV